MKTLRRDIGITLIIKLCLLIGLWYCFFSGPKSLVLNSSEWFFGSAALKHSVNSYQKVNSNDSR